jgi:hypothetical protein
VESLDPETIVIWAFALLVDVLASLNTVRLDKDKTSCCTRPKIMMEYLRKQSYIDAGMVVYLSVDWSRYVLPLHLGAHAAVLILLVLKLNVKGDMLRT